MPPPPPPEAKSEEAMQKEFGLGMVSMVEWWGLEGCGPGFLPMTAERVHQAFLLGEKNRVAIARSAALAPNTALSVGIASYAFFAAIYPRQHIHPSFRIEVVYGEGGAKLGAQEGAQSVHRRRLKACLAAVGFEAAEATSRAELEAALARGAEMAGGEGCPPWAVAAFHAETVERLARDLEVVKRASRPNRWRRALNTTDMRPPLTFDNRDRRRTASRRADAPPSTHANEGTPETAAAVPPAAKAKAASSPMTEALLETLATSTHAALRPFDSRPAHASRLGERPSREDEVVE